MIRYVVSSQKKRETVPVASEHQHQHQHQQNNYTFYARDCVYNRKQSRRTLQKQHQQKQHIFIKFNSTVDDSSMHRTTSPAAAKFLIHQYDYYYDDIHIVNQMQDE